MIHILNNYSSLITAIATAALAVVTYLYIKEIRLQTRESARPLLFISYPENEKIIAVNVGKGPAYSIKIVNAEFKSPYDISFPLFPDDYGVIYFKTDFVKSLRCPTRVSYLDLYSNYYESEISWKLEKLPIKGDNRESSNLTELSKISESPTKKPKFVAHIGSFKFSAIEIIDRDVYPEA